MLHELTLVEIPGDHPTPLMRDIGRLVIADLHEDGSHDLVVKEKDLSAYLGAVRDYETYYALVDLHGKPYAVASVVDDDKEQGVTRIYEFVVAHDQRRKGIGRLLMRHIAMASKARGNTTIKLLPWSEGFYRRLGFARSRGHYGEIQATVDALLSTPDMEVSLESKSA